MFNVTVIGSWALVELAGEFDVVNAETIRCVAADLVEQGATDLTVDLSHVSFMGAAGLNAVRAANQVVDAADGRMVIVGAPPFTRRLFAVTGLDRTLPLSDPPALAAPPLYVRGGQAELSFAPRRPNPRASESTGPTVSENLRGVAHQAVQTVPGCTAASIAVLAHGEARTVVVSDPVAINLDIAQYTVNEGPCLRCAQTAKPVRADPLTSDNRFARFAPLAAQAGIYAVLSVPVTIDTELVGTVNLYSATTFGPTAETTAKIIAAQTAAAAAAPVGGFCPTCNTRPGTAWLWCPDCGNQLTSPNET